MAASRFRPPKEARAQLSPQPSTNRLRAKGIAHEPNPEPILRVSLIGLRNKRRTVCRGVRKEWRLKRAQAKAAKSGRALRPGRTTFARRKIIAAGLFLFAVLSLASCTQWGTSLLSGEGVWWACPDRAAACSPENASLTLLQMDNTSRSVKVELCRAAGSGLFADPDLAALRRGVAEMDAARARVTAPTWDAQLADYVQATVTAEMAATKLYGRLYGYGIPPWTPNEAQKACFGESR